MISIEPGTLRAQARQSQGLLNESRFDKRRILWRPLLYMPSWPLSEGPTSRPLSRFGHGLKQLPISFLGVCVYIYIYIHTYQVYITMGQSLAILAITETPRLQSPQETTDAVPDGAPDITPPVQKAGMWRAGALTSVTNKIRGTQKRSLNHERKTPIIVI